MIDALLNLLIILGCAIIFGLICIVLAITWWAVKFISHAAKEAWTACSPAKDAPIDMSDVTQNVINTSKNEKN